eukprot:12096733-Ditylum_brightwellii.AAC.1
MQAVSMERNTKLKLEANEALVLKKFENKLLNVFDREQEKTTPSGCSHLPRNPAYLDLLTSVNGRPQTDWGYEN